MSFLDRFFKPGYDDELKQIQPIITAVNQFEEVVSQKNDAELIERLAQFRKEVATGTTLEEVLPEVFALVREAATRTLSMRHYD